VVLPLINKSFAQSLPYGITFISELVFGITLAWSICLFHKAKRPGFIFREQMYKAYNLYHPGIR
jgi:hypothetical protein